VKADAGASAEAPVASPTFERGARDADAKRAGRRCHRAKDNDDCAAAAAPFEEKVRAKFNECYQAGKKKNPELAARSRSR
jgi:hypothetical protein